jgi:hypothetical protein
VCGGLVVVAASADCVSHPAHQHHYQTDDEEDDADDHAYMGEREGRNEAREDESEDDKDDSKNDHDEYLVSVEMFGRRIAASVRRLIACQVGDIRQAGQATAEFAVPEFRANGGNEQGMHAVSTATGGLGMYGAS